MPLADPRNIGREQAYGYSPSGPGPYAPQVQRQVPDLQPYYPHRYTSPPQGTSHVWGSGGYGDSPSGPYGQHFAPGGLATGPRYQTPQEPSLGNLLRTIQTTDPGAGYGQSPSGPTAQMPPTQLRPQGVNSAGQRVVSQFDPQINPLDHSVLPNLDSPSFWAQQPARTPKPMSPFYEGPRPTIGVTRETRSPIAPTSNRRAMVQESKDYARSPSNPNWRPPGG